MQTTTYKKSRKYVTLIPILLNFEKFNDNVQIKMSESKGLFPLEGCLEITPFDLPY